MDGFDSREGVIVLAATNRADVLDAALLRPGRFDRRVVVQRPDRAGRAAILEVHTRNVPLAPDVSLERIAAETPGLVGAELRNLVNEAALLAARKDASAVRAEDFAEALQKITLGPARHILLNPGRSRAHRLPRGGPRAARAAGARQRSGSPRLDRAARHGAGSDLPAPRRRSHQLRRGLPAGAHHQRARRPGGRAARLRRGDDGRRERPPAGHGDRAHMVLRWGMSEKLGPISFVAPQDEGLPPAFQHQPYSEATSELIDAEVRRIVEECHRRGRTAAGRAPRAAGGARPGAAQGGIARRARDPEGHRPGRNARLARRVFDLVIHEGPPLLGAGPVVYPGDQPRAELLRAGALDLLEL